MPPCHMVELMLMGLACYLLALVAWCRWSSDPWAVIGLVGTPVLLLALLFIVVAERRW